MPARTSARVPGAVLTGVEALTLLVVLVLAWKARSLWTMLPISDPDTWGYLNPALTWLSGLGFRQTDGRDWLYPAFLALCLKTSGSLTGILVWQRTLGLLSGVVMALVWRCWVALLPFGRCVRFVISLCGLLPIYLQLVNPQNILFEGSIRPEGVLPFFVYGQLACVMGYCRYRWQTPRARPSLILGAASMVLAYACLVLKPSWYFACATTSLPMLAGVFGRALPLKTRIYTPILGAAGMIITLWLPGRIWLIPDAASRTLLPDALFCVHVQLIDSLFQARLAKLQDSDPEKARLQALLTVMESEMKTAAEVGHTYEKLGINADYLMHSVTFTNAIYQYAGNDREKFRSFCFASYGQAITHYPLDYTKKIMVQFTHFLFPDGRSLFRDSIDVAQLYRDGTESFQPQWAEGLRPELQELYRRYLEDLAAQARIAKTARAPSKFREMKKLYARWTLPVDILFLLALLATMVWSPLRDLRVGGWAALFLFLAPFGNAFGVCIVHTLDIFRYRATLGGYLLFAVTAMAVFVVLVVARSLALTLGKRT